MIGHGLDQPRPSPDFANATYVADSQATVAIRHIAGDISGLQALHRSPAAPRELVLALLS
jgi:hypothetical protein